MKVIVKIEVQYNALTGWEWFAYDRDYKLIQPKNNIYASSIEAFEAAINHIQMVGYILAV